MAPINTNNRRYLLGSAHPTRKSPDSLFRTDVSNKVEDKLSLDSFLIVGNDYDFPKEDVVPPGFYLSKITDASVRMKNGKKLLDVLYDIEGCDAKNDGKVFHIKQSYSENSDHHRVFSNAMVKAGVKTRSGASAVIGITECIKIAYVSNTSEIGSIVDRKPCDWEGADEAEPTVEDDPDYDNFLSDEDS